MDFNDRLFLIFEKLKEADKINTYTDLADILGTNKAGISDLKSKRKKVSVENLNCMIISYPEINPEWLLTGKGEMLRSQEDYENAVWEQLEKDNAKAKPSRNVNEVISLQKQVIENLERQNKLYEERVAELKERVAELKERVKELSNK